MIKSDLPRTAAAAGQDRYTKCRVEKRPPAGSERPQQSQNRGERRNGKVTLYAAADTSEAQQQRRFCLQAS